ncbi:MAG: ABC transporter permease, partial [Alphaproteobacteria bacterium]
ENLRVRAVIAAMTALAILIIYLPPFYLLAISFNPALQPGLPSPADLSFKWYIALTSERGLLAAFYESLLIAAVTSAISTLIALLSALAYLELGRLRRTWFLFVILPMFVPGVIQGLALSVILNRTGVTPFWGTVVIGHLLWALPFAFTVMLTSMVVVKTSYLLAASDLGASWSRRVVDIILPLVKPGIVGAIIFSFLLSLNEFARASYLVGRQNTLPITMFGKMNSGASPTIYALSGSIFIASIIAVAAFMYLAARQKRAGTLVES